MVSSMPGDVQTSRYSRCFPPSELIHHFRSRLPVSRPPSRLFPAHPPSCPSQHWLTGMYLILLNTTYRLLLFLSTAPPPPATYCLLPAACCPLPTARHPARHPTHRQPATISTTIIYNSTRTAEQNTKVTSPSLLPAPPTHCRLSWLPAYLQACILIL